MCSSSTRGSFPGPDGRLMDSNRVNWNWDIHSAIIQALYGIASSAMVVEATSGEVGGYPAA